jgi:UDP-N-acetylglucosamine 2-epimerase
MKIVSIVGARPQFIKSAPVSIALANAGHVEYKIHTGQHYDYELSQVFFEDLELQDPSINLGIGSGTHAQQTGKILVAIEPVLIEQVPDVVVVYGDTNSTLAGALAAAKLRIKLAHIEAGLRSFNRQMPEEHNRVLTDHCSDLLFCPTKNSVENLSHEGIKQGVHLVGDTMLDAVLKFSEAASKKSKILERLNLVSKNYLLATIHRANNVDNPEILSTIITAFRDSDELIIFPIHPRTIKTLRSVRIQIPNNVKMIDPIGYLDMLMLEKNSRIILTDSGGIQKEAYFFKVPCITLRNETEWVETVISGWNKVTGTNPDSIIAGIKQIAEGEKISQPYFGDGHASEKIVAHLMD